MSSRSALENAQIFCRENPKSPLCNDVPGFYEYRIDLAPNAAHPARRGLQRSADAWPHLRGAGVSGPDPQLAQPVGRERLHDPDMLPDDWASLHGGRLLLVPEEDCECLWAGELEAAARVLHAHCECMSPWASMFFRSANMGQPAQFIPCDVVSLVLQAVGGALAATAAHNHESASLGSNIMIAGLAFQVATMLGFITAASDFALRTYRRYRAQGASALSQDAALVRMRRTLRFKLFLGALSLASVLILWRSAFRVAELSEGWTGPIMADQDMFVGFEGVLIVVAVLALNVFHPGICAKELFAVGGGLKGCWCMRRKKGAAAKDARSLSDGETKPAYASA
ncbi:parasitic phase-specific protein PSP-1, partial [Metarhizium majus ARSEF 297]